jgi:NAD(P)-dependent dehydrogenase (short-subunit alcohol dehydrogenase family)
MRNIKDKHWPSFIEEHMSSQEGKVVAITGCTSGTGLTMAILAADHKARVIMLNRQSDRAKEALDLVIQRAKMSGAPEPLYIECDLSKFSSVRAAATKIVSECKETGLDVLCNNAGIMNFPDNATEDGCDIQMQTNHLGHFLLTALTMPAMEIAATKRGESRIVNHSSALRNSPEKGWNNRLQRQYLEKKGGNLGGDKKTNNMTMSGPGWQRYQQTKMANVVFTYALRDRLNDAESKVKALVAHPGVAPTQLHYTSNDNTAGKKSPRRLMRTMSKILMHSQSDGSIGICKCAFARDVKSGEFYGPRGKSYKPGKHNRNEYKGDAEIIPEEPLADKSARDMLWEASEESTGQKFIIGKTD